MSFFVEEEKPTETASTTVVSGKKENTLWVEKYRPTTLADYVGNEHIKEKVKDYLESGDIPHLLFCGGPGTGKTTLAKIITKSIPCDVLSINASNENSVDTIRNKIQGFASSAGYKDLKVVNLDEADFITMQGQAALRFVMEAFSSHTRFILTCNYAEKIIPAINSRCQVEKVIPPSKKDVAIRLNYILKAENIDFKMEDIKIIVDSSYPDIRKTINYAQQSCIKGVLKINRTALIESDCKLKILELIGKDKKEAFTSIRQTIADNQIRDFTDIYKLLYDRVDEYGTGHIAACILILAESEYKDSFVVDKEINFMACIIQLLNELKG